MDSENDSLFMCHNHCDVIMIMENEVSLHHEKVNERNTTSDIKALGNNIKKGV